MKLNALEFLFVNSPFRALVQEYYGLPILLKLLPAVTFDSVLEIGCGSGAGAKLIRKYFNPANITACDIDERMIRMAQARVHHPSLALAVMDSSEMAFSDAIFDGVFDFGIIHHIPNWRDCIKEVHRVLKPGGYLIVEDLSTDTFSGFPGKLWKAMLVHPYDEMYSIDELICYLEQTGFKIMAIKPSNPFKLIKFFSLTAIKIERRL